MIFPSEVKSKDHELDNAAKSNYQMIQNLLKILISTMIDVSLSKHNIYFK